MCVFHIVSKVLEVLEVALRIVERDCREGERAKESKVLKLKHLKRSSPSLLTSLPPIRHHFEHILTGKVVSSAQPGKRCPVRKEQAANL